MRVYLYIFQLLCVMCVNVSILYQLLCVMCVDVSVLCQLLCVGVYIPQL